MALGSEADEGNDVVSSDPLTEETTAAMHLITSPSPSSSSDTLPLPTLPFDIGVEILSRLPVKFLMQFQCVCKSWKSLISDRKFAKKHLRRASQSLILTSRNPDLVLLALPLSSVFTQVATTAMQLEYPVDLVTASSVSWLLQIMSTTTT